MFLSATVVYNRLREHGHWVRQHCRETTSKDVRIAHPLVDFLQWETQDFERSDVHRKSRKRGPRDALLAMANFETYEELMDAAKDKRKWRRIVEAETMFEQMSVAQDVSNRRKCEQRRWLPSDHTRLMKWARGSALDHFNRCDE